MIGNAAGRRHRKQRGHRQRSREPARLLLETLPSGDDLARINAKTRVVAINIPNDALLEGKTWRE